jgi:hypothetical protein
MDFNDKVPSLLDDKETI